METVNFDERPEMVEQAKRILCKCNGLPLAINTIAGFLATRPKTAPEWKKFNEHFSFEFENNPSLEMIRTVLTSNCEALPYHLQLCFLYLSIFPEDQNIRRRRLVRRWIAEGYSNGTHNRTAEENGEGYFAELISRSIIQPSESVAGSGASIGYSHVHNLLHEISVSESAKEKFSFVLHNHSNLQTNDTIRHLSIQSSWKRVEAELKSIGNLSQLRSLTVCGEWQSFFILEGMGMIRVLDLEGTSGLKDHHVKHIITKLIHLKYLSLRGCDDLFCLPNSLGNLWDLQTLDVRGTHIILLPATIVKLQKLQYLRAGLIPEDEQLRDPMGERDMEDGMTAAVSTTCKLIAATVGLRTTIVGTDDNRNRKDALKGFLKNTLPCLVRGLDIHGVEVPKGIGNLNSMHTLGVVNFSAGEAVLTELGNASQLRKLGVTGIKRDNSQQFFSAISKLIHLESLSIRSEGKPGLQDCLNCKSSSPPRDLRSLKLYGNLVTLPPWVSRLQNLAKLKLRSTRLGQDAIQVMGQLPLLTLLCLLHNAVEGQDQDLRFHFKSGSFPALVLLQLHGLRDLRSVEFEQNAATKLELLQVKGCNNMDKDGFSGLSFLQSLKQVSLEAGHGYDDKFIQKLRTQLSGNPCGPILREI